MKEETRTDNILHHVEVGSGIPILILHGGKLDHRHMIDAIEPVFADLDGWRRVYVDLPGCGKSIEYGHINSQNDVLVEIVRFVNSIINGEPCAIIGESRGSYIAQGLAYTHAELVLGMTLIVPGGNSTEAQKHLPEPIALRPANHLRSELTSNEVGRFDRLVVQNRSILEKIRATKIPAVALHNADIEARVMQQFAFPFDEAISQSTFDKPSLIISGRQDSIAGYSDTIRGLATYPRATYALLDCAGHSLAWERPELFKCLILDWLERLKNI